MAQQTSRQREALVEEIVLALGDHAPRKLLTWWGYFFTVTELGAEAVRELVRDAHAVEAQGGMTTQDGSRRRTLGGIFFVLAKERLGPKRARKVRERTRRAFETRMVQQLAKLLALVAPPQAPEQARPSELAGDEAELRAHGGAALLRIEGSRETATGSRSGRRALDDRKPARGGRVGAG